MQKLASNFFKYVAQAHSLPLELVVTISFIVSLLRNHNSNLCSDHNNKLNVLPQYAVALFKFSGTKASKQFSFLDVYGLNPKLFWSQTH